MNTALMVLLEAGLILLIGDLISGTLHWLEDSYGSEQTPVLGRIVVTPNVIHHHRPREFTKSPFWRRNSVTAILAIIIFICGAVLVGPSWQLYFFCTLAVISNELHCWAHRTPEENGRLITRLQQLRILQTPAHHAVHHTDPKNRAYCVLTNFLNPLLDSISFWRHLETIITFIFRVHPRADPSLNAATPNHAMQQPA